MEIGISLGSNLGHRLRNLEIAVRRLNAIQETSVIARSPVYTTEPVDVSSKYKHIKFLNAVVIVETALRPEIFFIETRNIERLMGRPEKRRKNIPRRIDIDIIYAGRRRIRSKGLKIPHPKWIKRRFVLQPLADVRPDLVIPGTKKSVSKILTFLNDNFGIRRTCA